MQIHPRAIVMSVMIAYASSSAFYSPVYVPMVNPGMYSQSEYSALEVVDRVSRTKIPGSDTLVRSGDTLGLMIAEASADDGSRAQPGFQGWRDSLLAIFKESVRITLTGGVVLKEAVASGSGLDSLSLDLSAFNVGGGGGGSPRLDTAGKMTKIGLGRPDLLSGAKAVLVLRESFVTRLVVPAAPNPVRVFDVQVSWGLWDPHASRWVAWGLVPLRESKTEIGGLSGLESGRRLSKNVLENAPIPSSIDEVRRKYRRSKLGGLLIGLDGRMGFHTGGDLQKLVKESKSNASVDEAELAFSASWFPSNWGVGVKLPFVSTIEASVKENSSTYGGQSESKGVKLFSTFKPEIELSGMIPFESAGLIGNIGLGYMSLKGSDAGWNGEPPDGSGWFWRPSVGYYSAFRHAYLSTDLGLEMQSYDLEEVSFKSSVFYLRFQFGLRLAHD